MEENNKIEEETVSQNNDQIVQEPQPIEKPVVQETLEQEVEPQEKPKKKWLRILIIIAFIFMIICALFYVFVLKPKYEGEKKDSSSKPSASILIVDEAITIAKEKLELAKMSNLINDTCFDGNKPYSEEGVGSRFCYYGTLEKFKNKFYNVYSLKLDYKDVLVEYKLPSEETETNVSSIGNIQGYVVDGDSVYTDSCASGVGVYKRMDKFTVEDITIDTIKLNYVVIGNSIPEIPEESEEYEYSDATMTLVKENGQWKILKATIVDMCNGVYEVGK